MWIGPEFKFSNGKLIVFPNSFLPILLLLYFDVTSIFPAVLQVKHSRTSPSSYKKDFQELIDVYARKRKAGEKQQRSFLHASDVMSKADAISQDDMSDNEDGYSDRDDEVYSTKKNGSRISKGKEMSVEYLENEVDVFQSVDDWDGSVVSNSDVLNLAFCFLFFLFFPPCHLFYS